jgi:hypothetical protein
MKQFSLSERRLRRSRRRRLCANTEQILIPYLLTQLD